VNVKIDAHVKFLLLPGVRIEAPGTSLAAAPVEVAGARCDGFVAQRPQGVHLEIANRLQQGGVPSIETLDAGGGFDRAAFQGVGVAGARHESLSAEGFGCAQGNRAAVRRELGAG
jgi:hypothetical protein